MRQRLHVHQKLNNRKMEEAKWQSFTTTQTNGKKSRNFSFRHDYQMNHDTHPYKIKEKK